MEPTANTRLTTQYAFIQGEQPSGPTPSFRSLFTHCYSQSCLCVRYLHDLVWATSGDEKLQSLALRVRILVLVMLCRL